MLSRPLCVIDRKDQEEGETMRPDAQARLYIHMFIVVYLHYI